MSTYTATMNRSVPPPATPYRHPLSAGAAPAGLWALSRLLRLAGPAAGLIAAFGLLEGLMIPQARPSEVWIGAGLLSMLAAGLLARQIDRATAEHIPGALGYRTADDPGPSISQVLLRQGARLPFEVANLAVLAWLLTGPVAQAAPVLDDGTTGPSVGTVAGYMLLGSLGFCAMGTRPGPGRAGSLSWTLPLVVSLLLDAAEWAVIVTLSDAGPGVVAVMIGAGLGLVVSTTYRVLSLMRADLSDTAHRPWAESLAGAGLTWWNGSATVTERQRAARWVRLALIVAAVLLAVAVLS